MILRILLFLACLTISIGGALAQSNQFYCDERELGDSFYCENAEELEQPVEVLPPPPGAPIDEIKEFNAFKQSLDDARALAVFTGKKDHVEAYMVLQKEAASMSSRFMEQYQVIGWQNPELSYVASVPIETGGKQAYRSERRRHLEQHLRRASRDYGLFYFYSDKCAACNQFSPVVKLLSERHNMTVIPVAKPGNESISWPGTKPDNGIGERVGLQGDVTPALALYSSQQDASVVLSYGVVSLASLEERIYMLTREEKVKFLGGDDDVR